MWRMLFTMDPFMPLDSLSSDLKCLLCRGESSGADDVQRLYCAHCAWFHEPVDETRLNMVRHIQTALGEVQAALEIAKSLADETHRSGQLTVAHRELPASAISRLIGASASA
jgi:hypothetical protein